MALVLSMSPTSDCFRQWSSPWCCRSDRISYEPHQWGDKSNPTRKCGRWPRCRTMQGVTGRAASRGSGRFGEDGFTDFIFLWGALAGCETCFWLSNEWHKRILFVQKVATRHAPCWPTLFLPLPPPPLSLSLSLSLSFSHISLSVYVLVFLFGFFLALWQHLPFVFQLSYFLHSVYTSLRSCTLVEKVNKERQQPNCPVGFENSVTLHKSQFSCSKNALQKIWSK